MTVNRNSGVGDEEGGSWASETLPLSIRKELLERELKKLGFRKEGSRASASAGSLQQQQQPQQSHPQADAGGDHAD